MSRGSVTPMTLGLLVIGILVGVAGGYLYTNSTFEPQIVELEESVSDHQSQLDSLHSEASDLEAEITSLESEKTSKESQLVELESDFEDVSEELDEVQQDFDVVAEERNALEEKIVAEDGYYKLKMYGFSIDYPDDMTLSLIDSLGLGVDRSQGTVSGENDVGEFALGWFSFPYYPEVLEVTLNGSITVLTDLYDLNVGEYVNASYGGLDGIEVEFDGYDDEGVYGVGKYFAFYSDAQSRLFIIGYSYESREEYESHSHIMESFRLEG